MKLKELLKLEPTKQEKKYISKNKDIIEKIKYEEIVKDKMKERQKIKDLYCMGIKTKLAKGPNPLSIRKKV
jgi:high-affinity K+ transport system ATPase subunit B